MFKYLLFDLDGTIIDSSEGVTKSSDYALRQIGIDPPPLDELLCFIGPPPTQAFEEFYGLTGEENARACGYFRKYYKQGGISQYTVFPGIVEIIAELHDKGIPMSIATTKQEPSARKILDESGVTEYINLISGAVPGEREDKAAVIKNALKLLDIEPDKESVAIIGDRKYDVEGAQICGISSIGVGYGFAPVGELEDSADIYVENIAELRRVLLES